MSDGASTLTLVVPTYQRREPLLRLLESLRAQFARAPGTDVLVVSDGSTDGTAERVEGLDYPVPLRVLRQSNAGLAAARNAGLAAARGELVWFLDDDMLAGDRLVAAHRAAHAGGRRRIVIGPCPLPPEARAVAAVREWADAKHAALARGEHLADAAYFSAANTSAPADLWRDAGGFDPGFVGWGGEDYEIAIRLLATGVEIAFAPEAIAFHHQDRGVAGFRATKRDEGRNTVRIVRKHPATAEELLPPLPGRLARALRAVPGRRPGAYAALGAFAGAGARAAPGAAGRSLLGLAGRLSFLAGVGELDPAYLARLLGAAEASRRDSRQPRNRPTGSQ